MGQGAYYSAKNTERGNGATALHASVENGHAEASFMLPTPTLTLTLMTLTLTLTLMTLPLTLTLTQANRMLLGRGARQLPSMEGATPLIIALQYRHPAIALDLARASPTPSLDATVPIDGSSALFVAAGYGYTEVHTCTHCTHCTRCTHCSQAATPRT